MNVRLLILLNLDFGGERRIIAVKDEGLNIIIRYQCEKMVDKTEELIERVGEFKIVLLGNRVVDSDMDTSFYVLPSIIDHAGKTRFTCRGQSQIQMEAA